MKAYKVNVNGNVYEITLEIIDKKDIGTTAPATPAASAASATPAQAAPVAPAAPAQAGSTTISAPMPGTILKINVANGQAVKKGDVLMILEAMKMENEITSPIDGTVASVNIQTGATVDTGVLLCTLA
ncbi:MAG: acetyl-CoA carboxylase biotin carboxyl carrier protein subunit [Ruminococcaceae bacterium]|nr:acetyl-CoA carboxylase biotin carboxyl carrier protein subunit [Oscillospiraceae bacterium]